MAVGEQEVLAAGSRGRVWFPSGGCLGLRSVLGCGQAASQWAEGVAQPCAEPCSLHPAALLAMGMHPACLGGGVGASSGLGYPWGGYPGWGTHGCGGTRAQPQPMLWLTVLAGGSG